MILYGYPTSPYARKVAAMLRHLEIPFEERHVHPLRRGEIVRLTGQRKVPVLLDGDRAIFDSTRIARHLDEKFPGRGLYPKEQQPRALALLLEDWADEALAGVVLPALYFIPYNADRMFARMRAAYPPGRIDDVAFAAVRRVVAAAMIRRHGEPYGWKPRTPAVLNRLADVLDSIEDAIGPSGWIVGDRATAADFAVYGFLHLMENMDGWETVRSRKKVLRILRALGLAAPEDAAVRHAEADGQAVIDARSLRARKKVRA